MTLFSYPIAIIDFSQPTGTPLTKKIVILKRNFEKKTTVRLSVADFQNENKGCVTIFLHKFGLNQDKNDAVALLN